MNGVANSVKDLTRRQSCSEIEEYLISKPCLDKGIINRFQSSTSNFFKDSHNNDDVDFLVLELGHFLKFQARRKSCTCSFCGCDMKNQKLKKRSEYVDPELALVKQLEIIK